MLKYFFKVNLYLCDYDAYQFVTILSISNERRLYFMKKSNAIKHYITLHIQVKRDKTQQQAKERCPNGS